MHKLNSASVTFVVLLIILLYFISPSIRTDNLYFAHDSEAHIARISSYIIALQDGDLPVNWAKNLFNGIGSPVLILNYQLPYYAASILYFLGLGLFKSYVYLTYFSLISSFILFYLLLRYKFGSYSALVGSVIYALVPYRLLDIYIRSSFGENFAYVFLPIILYGLFTESVLITSLSLTGLYMSHPIFSAVFTVYFFGYSILEVIINKQSKYLKTIFVSFIIAFLLASYNLIPTIFLTKFTAFSPSDSKTFDHFLNVDQLKSNYWGFGYSVKGFNDEMPFQIGIITKLILGLSFLLLVFLLFRKRFKKNILFFYTFVFTLIMLFLTLEKSEYIWHYFKLNNYIDFPWRFLLFLPFGFSVLAIYLINSIRKKTYRIMISLILICIAILTVKDYFKSFGYYEWSEKYYFEGNHTGDIYGEYRCKFRDDIWGSKFDNRYSIIYGYAVIDVIENKTSILTLKSSSSGEFKMRFNIMYFPGWNIYIDDRKLNIAQSCVITPRREKKADDSGLIECLFPSGDHIITAKYELTNYHKIGYIFSFLGILALLCLIILKTFPLLFLRSTKKIT